MRAGTGRIHKLDDNRFRIKGSHLLFVLPNPSTSQLRLLKELNDNNLLIKLTIKRVVGSMALVHNIAKLNQFNNLNTRG